MKGRGSWLDSMQIAGTAVISEGHKEVVNIRKAGAASKCSASNAIRILIWSNSLKPLFGTPLNYASSELENDLVLRIVIVLEQIEQKLVNFRRTYVMLIAQSRHRQRYRLDMRQMIQRFKRH